MSDVVKSDLLFDGTNSIIIDLIKHDYYKGGKFLSSLLNRFSIIMNVDN